MFVKTITEQTVVEHQTTPQKPGTFYRLITFVSMTIVYVSSIREEVRTDNVLSLRNLSLNNLQDEPHLFDRFPRRKDP